MLSQSKFIFLCSLIFLINPAFSQHPYDNSNCTSSKSQVHGYICHSNDSSCETYIVYRAQPSFHSITSIASLFSLTPFDLLEANNFMEVNPRNLPVGREIIIPISCQCHDGSFRAPLTFQFLSRDSVNVVACEVFEGLVKAQGLVQENPELRDFQDHPEDYQINVPIRCACPDSIQRRNGVEYLVTYPILEGDNPDLIAYKFNLTEQSVSDANNMRRHDAIFPKTTLLVPTNNLSKVNWDIRSIPRNSPAPKATFKVISPDTESTKWHKNPHVYLGAGVCFAVITMLISCGILRNIRKMNNPGRFLPFSARSSGSSNVSQDFRNGVSKLKNPIINYSLEDIRIATENFGKDFMIRQNVYRGRIGSSYLLFERMDSDKITRNVIEILTKINHFNIVKLQGFCDEDKPYIVVEYPENSSLESCLSSSESKRQLTWGRRLQIAFDLAAALHYLHNSTKPPFVHHNINSRNVLLTIDWRAKLSGFSSAKPMIEAIEEKEDVYAFGIVLLELVSGKKIRKYDEKLQASQNELENLREMMDPEMDGNYGEGEAICLVVLAKSCIEEDPNHRPTMNDILIALSRIL
ncbi:Protein kinase superfamily protein [Euphorbia peplus]|nr:Protein kinase superfamily protein [Euphorbia peplus]